MFATLLNLSLLALALPVALAGYHGNWNPIMYRHPHGLAKRAEGHVELFKRVDNARWSFYNAETGNALVPNYSSAILYLTSDRCWFLVQGILWTNALKQWFRMFLTRSPCFPYAN